MGRSRDWPLRGATLRFALGNIQTVGIMSMNSESSARAPKTMYDKIWDSHLVYQEPGDDSAEIVSKYPSNSPGNLGAPAKEALEGSPF